MFSTYAKDTILKEYSLYVSNTGPYNSVWYEKTFETKKITVYARPQTPQSLVVKGNGNSNTLVCFMEQEDDVLTEREYYYVFGYTDANGVEYLMPPTKNRWYQFESAISVKNNQNRFWVCTQWIYDDANKVTSGRVYLDGSIDEQFDASCFYNINVGTRGDNSGCTTGIEEMEEYDKLYFDGRKLLVETNCPVDCMVKILSLEGRCLEVKNFGRKQVFDEKIELSDYSSGIYIINAKIGKMFINRKVLVP